MYNTPDDPCSSSDDLTVYGFSEPSNCSMNRNLRAFENYGDQPTKRSTAYVSSKPLSSTISFTHGSILVHPPLFKAAHLGILDQSLLLVSSSALLSKMTLDESNVSNCHIKILSDLPPELLLSILSFMSNSSLKTVRSCSKSFLILANQTLYDRLKSELGQMEASTEAAWNEYLALKTEKDPHLTHYRSFLIPDHTQALKEATWYTSPPAELKTVCECLCILRGMEKESDVLTKSKSFSSANTLFDEENEESPDSRISVPSSDSLSWPAMKKSMTRYDFKKWFRHIEKNVHSIPIHAVRFVEDIIRNDPLITYERLREVSTAGYALLIVVAACLQYVNILQDLNSLEQVYQNRSESQKKLMTFLSCLGSTR